MRFMRKHLPVLLAVLMLTAVLPLSLTSCLHTANTIADAALEAIENYEGGEIQSLETGEIPPEFSLQWSDEERAGETVDTQPAETESPETQPAETNPPETEAETAAIAEDGWYDDRDNVALYLHTYGKLPPNYVSKADAEDLYGWEGGPLDQYAEGMAIGGSKFGNYEGLLPQKSGRQYYECDIDTVGTSSRGAKRIVYSNDGLIYYTDDHYETFELLYGEE